MFEPSICDNCEEREIVRTYPETYLCQQCEVMLNCPVLQFLPFSTSLGLAVGQLDLTIAFDYQRGARKRFLMQSLPFSTSLGLAAGQFDLTIADLLIPFLCFDYQRGARKRFLYFTLLSHESRFRKFTYFRNGMRGSISQYEDVLDRILSYL